MSGLQGAGDTSELSWRLVEKFADHQRLREGCEINLEHHQKEGVRWGHELREVHAACMKHSGSSSTVELPLP